MKIGEKMRSLRKSKGITQKELAKLCGLNEVTIRSYELGKFNPKIETVQKIADALEVPEYELTGEKPLMTIKLNDGTTTEVDLSKIAAEIESGSSSEEYIAKRLKELGIIHERTKTEDYLESFLNYLESLGYIVGFYDSVEMKRSLTITPECEDDYLVAIEDIERDNVTFFHKKDFMRFQKEVEKTIEFEIYKQFTTS